MHPVFLKVGDSFFIGTYGVMIALGLIAALSLASWRAKRRGLSADAFFDMTFVAVISGFVFARILFIALNWQAFLDNPKALILSRTGFVFLGGLVGAIACTTLYVRWKKLPAMAMADLAAPSLALAHAFGRLGCHFAGCCFGGVCGVPGIGIHLHRHEMPGSTDPWTGGPEPFFNAFEEHLEQGLIPAGASESLAVWPIQLMEAAGLLALVAFLLWFASKPRRPGQTLALYLGLYGVLRFVLEYFRGDSGRGFLVPDLVSTSQAISLALIPAAVAVWAWSRRQPVRPFPSPGSVSSGHGDEVEDAGPSRRRRRDRSRD